MLTSCSFTFIIISNYAYRVLYNERCEEFTQIESSDLMKEN